MLLVTIHFSNVGFATCNHLCSSNVHRRMKNGFVCLGLTIYFIASASEEEKSPRADIAYLDVQRHNNSVFLLSNFLCSIKITC